MEIRNTKKTKKRKLDKRKIFVFVCALISCILIVIAGTIMLNNHFEKVKEEKAKVQLEEKKKKEAQAKKKEEERKQKELEEALNSIKPPEFTEQDDLAIGVPKKVLAVVTKDSIDKAFESVLVIGDSRTEGLKLFSGVKTAKFFSTKSLTVNRIYEGKKVIVDGAELSIYDVLGQEAYGKVVICVGLNEVGWGNVEKFIESYGSLVDKIMEMQPQAQIYLHSILPVSKSKNDKDAVFNNANIAIYNEGIVRLVSEKNIKFVNSAPPLIDNAGYLLEEASSDGVHLSGTYCRLWAQSLADIISPGILVNEGETSVQTQEQETEAAESQNQPENQDEEQIVEAETIAN